MDQFTYRYETHLHTKEASACSDCWAKDYIELYQKLGYSGIIVTDHFYHGNTAVPRDLPWDEWVDRFCLGYEHAKEEGDKRDFQVFFGWEENFNGDEYLIYGLDKEWLHRHPEMLTWSHQQQFDTVRKDGGLVVQAHPFREREYLSEINLHPNQVDAMEVANLGNQSYMDTLAYEYCKRKGIAMTSGSDMHHADNVSKNCFGMQFTKRLESIKDYVTAIKNLSSSFDRAVNDRVLITTKERFLRYEKPSLPVNNFE